MFTVQNCYEKCFFLARRQKIQKENLTDLIFKGTLFPNNTIMLLKKHFLDPEAMKI